VRVELEGGELPRAQRGQGMTGFYERCIRPALFSFESEEIHEHTLRMLHWLCDKPLYREALESFFGAPEQPAQHFGLSFAHPVGLAAGMDKFAVALPAWESLGFSFIELGGVTRWPQPGNPAPRLFRIVAERALINRMGFNNGGAADMAERLVRWKQANLWPRCPVGINLGKSKTAENAVEDYAASFRLLRAHADFFVVNVSSPNTPNLRALQEKAALTEILHALQQINREVGAGGSAPRPLLVKVAPDLSFSALDDILELVQSHGLAGVVATNTTIARPPSGDPKLNRIYAEAGGLSGAPLTRRSTEIIRHLHRQSQGRVRVIGVGGVFTAADAWEKIIAGASLIQIYTGLIYKGPGIVREIVTGLNRRLAERGMRDLTEAIGSEA
jgi:dihydroorotate dehydrogenase